MDAFYKATKVIDTKELQDIVKYSLKRCANSATIFGKINHDLLF